MPAAGAAVKLLRALASLASMVPGRESPLVYTFWSDRGPSIMTMSAALVE